MSRQWKYKTVDVRPEVYNKEYPFSTLTHYREKNFDGIDSISHYITNERIEYYLKTNSYGWRCDEFKKDHVDKNHILFAGCSETWGEGSVIEDCWSKMLYDSINKDDTCSGFFSIGIPGGGVDEIVNVVSEYIKEFGLPDAIFFMLPNVPRQSAYMHADDYNLFSGFYRVGAFDQKTEQPTLGKYTESDYNTVLIHNYLSIKIFESLLSKTKTDFFWSTWNYEFINDLELFNLHSDNFVDTSIVEERAYEDYIALNKNSIAMEKRDGHHGTVFHKYWAEQFYKKYKEKNEK
jgi:hypothetical protein